jgi:hypothetical protein
VHTYNNNETSKRTDKERNDETKKTTTLKTHARVPMKGIRAEIVLSLLLSSHCFVLRGGSKLASLEPVVPTYSATWVKIAPGWETMCGKSEFCAQDVIAACVPRVCGGMKDAGLNDDGDVCLFALCMAL